MPCQNIRRIAYILKAAARAARNHTLLHIQSSVPDLVAQPVFNLVVVKTDKCLLLHLGQNILQVRVQLVDRISVARVERHGDHRADFREIDADHTVVICRFARRELHIISASSVNVVKFLHGSVRLPDRRQTGGLGCHNINSDAVVHTQIRHTVAEELHHLIVHIPVCEYLADNGERNILRSDKRRRLSGQTDADHLRHIDIVGLFQQLLYKLRPAFPDRHRAERTVSGMGIRAENHFTAACKHLPGKLMNDRLMRRHINPAVMLRAGKPEYMIVLVDRSADCAEAVVAVRKHVRHREFLQAAGTRRLNNADKGDVMGGQPVKPQLEFFHAARGVVRFQNAVGHRLLCGLLLRYHSSELCFKLRLRQRPLLNNLSSVQHVSALLK